MVTGKLPFPGRSHAATSLVFRFAHLSRKVRSHRARRFYVGFPGISVRRLLGTTIITYSSWDEILFGLVESLVKVSLCITMR
jgi:hypothetical protein